MSESLARRLRAVFTIDLRTLALFRVLLATMILLDLALRSRHLVDFYTDLGVLPRRFWLDLTHKLHWSLHAASGEPGWQILLFALAALAALALLVGYRTRLASVLTFVLLASLLNRNGLVLQAGDQLLVILAFWAMFLPLGAHRSVDAALDPARRDAPNSPRVAPGVPAPHFSVATVAVILQVLYLYTFTALLKTGDAWTSRFDAAFYAVSLQHFATPIGAWFAQFPTLLKAATLYVLAVEFVAPVLVLLPFLWPWLRLAGLALLASLHAAFGLMLHIGLFPLIDFTALSLLVPGALWVMLARRRARHAAAGAANAPPPDPREAIVMHYDEDCGFCLKTCLILRELLVLPQRLAIVPAQRRPEIGELLEREDSWVVTDAAGRPHLRWRAMLLLLRRSPVLAPLGLLLAVPPLPRLGEALYRLIAHRRGRLGELAARSLPWRPVRTRATVLGSALALFFLYVVTAYNVYELPQVRGAIPDHVQRAARVARLDQRWDMFAPYPLTVSIYPLVPGTLRDGTAVDLYPLTSSAADWKVPERMYPLYDGYRWRKYLDRVDSHRDNTVRRAFGDWMCRSWNRPGRPRGEQLATFEVQFVKLRTNTEGTLKEGSRRTVWRHWCFAEFAPKPA